MPKQCKAEGCRNNVFSHGYCRKHQHLRKDDKYKKQLEAHRDTFNKGKGFTPNTKKKGQNIKPVSKKRQKKVNIYRKTKPEFIEYKKDNNEYRCVFCGQAFDKEETPDLHHLIGRDEDLLIEMEYWELAHRECHTQYHDWSVSNIEWFKDFLFRIKERYPWLYVMEKQKQEKSKAIDATINQIKNNVKEEE